MIGYEEDYEKVEEHARYNKMIFGEFLFFAFGLEPQSFLDKCLSKTEHFAGRSSMKDFALDLLENGETVFRMSEKFRSNGGIGFT